MNVSHQGEDLRRPTHALSDKHIICIHITHKQARIDANIYWQMHVVFNTILIAFKDTPLLKLRGRGGGGGEEKYNIINYYHRYDVIPVFS